MGTRKNAVTVVSDGSGAATAYSPYFSGYIESIRYVKDGGANPYTNGVDFTMTLESTGESVWTQADVNASTIVRPRAPTYNQSGVAALRAAGGEAVLEKIAAGRDRIKIVLAQAGATKTGSFVITTSDK